MARDDSMPYRWVDRIGLGPVLAIMLVAALAWQNRELSSQLRDLTAAQLGQQERLTAALVKLGEAVDRQARAEEAHAAVAAGAGRR